jgi:hypothetical protein
VVLLSHAHETLVYASQRQPQALRVVDWHPSSRNRFLNVQKRKLRPSGECLPIAMGPFPVKARDFGGDNLANRAKKMRVRRELATGKVFFCRGLNRCYEAS